MLDLREYTCLGAALRDAIDRFAAQTCLIEADRDREKTQLSYSDFKELALPLARALEDAGFDAGGRAAMVMSLVQSAKLHGHDPWVYLKDVLERLLEHPNHRIDELLPHRWRLPADC